MAQWIALWVASRAKTLALQGAETGLTANAAACSLSLSASLPIAVRGTCFWRTSTASILPPPPLWTKKKDSLKNAQPPASWESWPTSGGTRNGSLFQRPKWEPATAAPAGSAGRGAWKHWATPTATENQNNRCGDEAMRRKSQRVGAQVTVSMQVRMWSTPDVSSGARDMSKIDPQAQKRADTKRTTGIATEAIAWETPKASMRAGRQTNAGGQAQLDVQANNWAAPTANAAQSPGHPSTKQEASNISKQMENWLTPSASDGTRGGTITPNMSGASLTQQVNTLWPTPAARDHKGPNSEQHATVTGGGRKHMNQLANFVAHTDYLHLAPAIPDGQTSSSEAHGTAQHSQPMDSEQPKLSSRLNPYFVEHLMGWPLGWTSHTAPSASRPAETELWRSKLQQQLSLLLGEPKSSL
jgi:hypothetical protein